MKAKNENQFVMMRLKKSTHKLLKRLNLDEDETSDKTIHLYETLDKIVKEQPNLGIRL